MLCIVNLLLYGDSPPTSIASWHCIHPMYADIDKAEKLSTTPTENAPETS